MNILRKDGGGSSSVSDSVCLVEVLDEQPTIKKTITIIENKFNDF